MSLLFNGIEPDNVKFNGVDVDSVSFNGVEVWSGLIKLNSTNYNDIVQTGGSPLMRFGTPIYKFDGGFVSYLSALSNCYIVENNTVTAKSKTDFGYVDANTTNFTLNGKRGILEDDGTNITLKCYRYDSTNKVEVLEDTKIVQQTVTDPWFKLGAYKDTNKLLIVINDRSNSTRNYYIYDTDAHTINSLTVVGLPDNLTINVVSFEPIILDTYIWVHIPSSNLFRPTSQLYNLTQIPDQYMCYPTLDTVNNILNLNAHKINLISGFDFTQTYYATLISTAGKVIGYCATIENNKLYMWKDTFDENSGTLNLKKQGVSLTDDFIISQFNSSAGIADFAYTATDGTDYYVIYK